MAIHFPQLSLLPLARYAQLLAPDRLQRAFAAVDELRRRFEGHAVWNVSSSAVGGGVAEMVRALLDPWADPITLRALAEVTMLGATGGALGCWIVLYSLSYSAESLAHGLFPGLVVAALICAPLLLGVTRVAGERCTP